MFNVGNDGIVNSKTHPVLGKKQQNNKFNKVLGSSPKISLVLVSVSVLHLSHNTPLKFFSSRWCVWLLVTSRTMLISHVAPANLSTSQSLKVRSLSAIFLWRWKCFCSKWRICEVLHCKSILDSPVVESSPLPGGTASNFFVKNILSSGLSLRFSSVVLQVTLSRPTTLLTIQIIWTADGSSNRPMWAPIRFFCYSVPNFISMITGYHLVCKRALVILENWKASHWIFCTKECKKIHGIVGLSKWWLLVSVTNVQARRVYHLIILCVPSTCFHWLSETVFWNYWLLHWKHWWSGILCWRRRSVCLETPSWCTLLSYNKFSENWIREKASLTSYKHVDLTVKRRAWCSSACMKRHSVFRSKWRYDIWTGWIWDCGFGLPHVGRCNYSQILLRLLSELQGIQNVLLLGRKESRYFSIMQTLINHAGLMSSLGRFDKQLRGRTRGRRHSFSTLTSTHTWCLQKLFGEGLNVGLRRNIPRFSCPMQWRRIWLFSPWALVRFISQERKMAPSKTSKFSHGKCLSVWSQVLFLKYFCTKNVYVG